jgi:hypothetical protein
MFGACRPLKLPSPVGNTAGAHLGVTPSASNFVQCLEVDSTYWQTPLKTWSLILTIAIQLSVVAIVSAAQPMPRLYEVTTETGMPHLEENLRYATRVERRCMDPQELTAAFWMLGDVSLQDCRLVKLSEEPDGVSLYKLKCSGGHGTIGSAQWQFGANLISGTLNVRLGGKNMTFNQRVTAKPLGNCG